MALRLLEDALERALAVPERPARIVSLVPSVTELLFDLGVGDRVVGVSRYCSEPAGGLDGLARVGGQKDPDLDALCALSPDLVVAVKEENLRRHVEALAERGVAVYVADVRSVEDALALPGEIGDVAGAEPARSEALGRQMAAGVQAARSLAAGQAPVPLFCPVWRDPWIAVGPDTYLHDVLRVCGGAPVPVGPPAPAAGPDRRYPKVTLDEVRAAAPALVLLPDEPYRFGAADAEELSQRLSAGPAAPPPTVRLVDGKLLAWYGRRTAGIVELATWISCIRRVQSQVPSRVR